MAQDTRQSDGVAEILARFPGPDSLRRSKRGSTLFLIGSLRVASVFGIWFLNQVGHQKLDVLFLGLVLFPLLCLATIAGLELTPPRIFVDSQGFPRPQNVTDILTQFPTPVKIRAPALLVIVPLIFVVPILALGLWGLWRSILTGDVVMFGRSVLLAVVCGPIAFLLIKAAAKGLPELKLDAEGFSVGYPWGTTRKLWCEASQFKPEPILPAIFVDRVVFHDASRPTGFRGRLWRSVTFNDTGLPNVYLWAKPLARLMNAWRERALAPPYGSSSVSQ
jgi:hypothetical protein